MRHCAEREHRAVVMSYCEVVVDSVVTLVEVLAPPLLGRPAAVAGHLVEELPCYFGRRLLHYCERHQNLAY